MNTTSTNIKVKDLDPRRRVPSNQHAKAWDIDHVRIDRGTVGSEQRAIVIRWLGDDGHPYVANLVNYGLGPWNAEDPEDWPQRFYYLVSIEDVEGPESFCGLVEPVDILKHVALGGRPIGWYPAHVLWVY